jgi:hypothetical protein
VSVSATLSWTGPRIFGRRYIHSPAGQWCPTFAGAKLETKTASLQVTVTPNFYLWLQTIKSQMDKHK